MMRGRLLLHRESSEMRQVKERQIEPVPQVATKQVKTHKHKFLIQDLYCSLLHQRVTPGMWSAVFMAAAKPECRDSG